jgi:DNA-binding MurR/RpiR family transcriptional regulator
MKTIPEIIKSKYNKLTPSQKKVARYLIRNPEDIILLKLDQISQKTKVSEATVARFVVSLGFSGVPEFRRKMSRMVVKNLSTSKRLNKSVDAFEGRNSVFADFLKSDIENILALTEKISDETFLKAVDVLCTSPTIYVLGLRGSYALAFYFVFYLRFFLPSVQLIKLGVGDIPEQLHNINESDVLIAISFKRYTRSVVEIMKKIKSRGVNLIAVTDDELSPISKIAGLSLFTNTESPSYIDSFGAPISLLGALVAAIAINKKEKAIQELNKLESEFMAFETFYHE